MSWRHLGLFAGIGGFEYAAQKMGWETVAWVEINPFCQQVLRHHFPNAIGHSDTRTTDFKPYANKIEILTGGFPCQPFSSAGQQKGKEDNRYLWPEMLRAVREIQPLYIVGENVSGLVSLEGGVVFEEVLASLEVEGYTVRPILIPASGKGAPHRRERVWIVAHRNGDRRQGVQQFEKGLESIGGWDALRFSHSHGESGITANAEGNGSNRASKSPGQKTSGQNRKHAQQLAKRGNLWPTANANDIESQGNHQRGKEEISAQGFGTAERWDTFPTQSPICGGDDGISLRLDSVSFSEWRIEALTALGNAIVPQVALQIFRALAESDESPFV